MEAEITLKNYRCFSDKAPARMIIREGFTALVGPNNSGKSALLKFFYEFRPLFEKCSSPNASFHGVLKGAAADTFDPRVADRDEIFHDGNSRDISIEVRFRYAPEDHGVYKDAPLVKRMDLTVPRRGNSWGAEVYLDERDVPLHIPDSAMGGGVVMSNGQRLIHLGPAIQLFSKLSQVLYIGPFRNAINVGSSKDYYDIQVGEAFIQRWRDIKTGAAKRANESAYRLTQDIKRIFGFESLEINASSDNLTLQLFVNGRSYKLSELGSGLAQFVLVLANAAVKRPTYIMIDEPELNLHPSLQIDFLTTLTSYASHGVFFATHSIGLARASAERIYSVRKEPQGNSRVFEFERTANLAEFLGELSFAGYRDMGFDSVLLVEGTSEVKTIQQFLRLYGKDHRVVLLPMGGASLINESSMAELLEIKRISSNVSAVIDSEKPSHTALLDSSRQGFVDACRAAGINCLVLERRATENYFPEHAVKSALGDNFSALKPYQLLKDAPNPWSKAMNWRIARQMSLTDIQGTDLGQFLESL